MTMTLLRRPRVTEAENTASAIDCHPCLGKQEMETRFTKRRQFPSRVANVSWTFGLTLADSQGNKSRPFVQIKMEKEDKSAPTCFEMDLKQFNSFLQELERKKVQLDSSI